jgi:putative ABC transport system permease protein
VVDALFPGISPLGQSVRIDGRAYQVVGTLSRLGKIMGDSQDLTVIIPFKTFYANFGRQRPFSIAVALKSAEDLRVAEDQLVGILRRSRGTPADKPDDFSINRPEMLAKTYEQLTGALFGVAVGVGLITLLVGGIGIMNIMLASVFEQTREIGVRRAVGALRRDIRFQFLVESFLVAGFGGGFGVLVGLFISHVVATMAGWPTVVTPIAIILSTGVSGAVGLFSGLYPAIRASRLDPIEALAHQ